MKYVFAIMMMAGAAASAQTCKSSLVYQVYNPCFSLDNGLNTAKATIALPAGDPQIAVTQGGHNLDEQCEILRKTYDRNDDENKMAYRGKIVSKQELPQIEHREKYSKILISVDYRYSCTIETLKIPYNYGPAKSCGGVAPQWYKADASTDPQSIGGQVKCLSCDGINDPKQALACISASVNEIIEPKAVAVDAKDLAAVQATLDALNDYEKAYHVLGLSGGPELAKINSKIQSLSNQQ